MSSKQCNFTCNRNSYIGRIGLFILLSVLLPTDDARSTNGDSSTGERSRNEVTYIKKTLKVACIPQHLEANGRYICDDEGKIRCLVGWADEHNMCNTPICHQNCSTYHGKCVQPNICSCGIGWTGYDCSKCIPLAGCKNGYCIEGFECRCKKGWTGTFCDEPLCRNTCGKHGYCTEPGDCRCHIGWKGPTCDDCIPLPGCSKVNGYCTKPLECNCKNGYQGTFCKERLNEVQCRRGCNLMQGFCKRPGFCSCNDGWSGPTCEDCARNPNCVNGYCTKAWECKCIKGYTGPLCDIPTNNTYTSGQNDSHLQLTRTLHHNIENIAQMHAKNIKKFRKAVTKLGLDDLSLFIFPEQI